MSAPADEVRSVIESLKSALHLLSDRSQRTEARKHIETAKRRLQSLPADAPELAGASHLLEEIPVLDETRASLQPPGTGPEEEHQEDEATRDRLKLALRSLLSYLSEAG